MASCRHLSLFFFKQLLYKSSLKAVWPWMSDLLPLLSAVCSYSEAFRALIQTSTKSSCQGNQREALKDAFSPLFFFFSPQQPKSTSHSFLFPFRSFYFQSPIMTVYYFQHTTTFTKQRSWIRPTWYTELMFSKLFGSYKSLSHANIPTVFFFFFFLLSLLLL